VDGELIEVDAICWARSFGGGDVQEQCAAGKSEKDGDGEDGGEYSGVDGEEARVGEETRHAHYFTCGGPSRMGGNFRGGAMRRLLFLAVMVLVGFGAVTARADATADIKQVLTDQAAAWNRGDVRTFMTGYDKSPETTFVGKKVTHGWQQVLDNYLKNYSTTEQMGKLDFSDLDVRVLDERTAVVTGRFHLARTDAGGGDASGYYSLVFLKTTGGWKIVLDHTSAD
jgi:uncharacterized protein (TIGR02246 family)